MNGGQPIDYNWLAQFLLSQNTRAPNSVARRPQGMRAEGNVDLTARPRVANEDGSHSTIRSMSVGFPEGETLIPTVRGDGWYMSPDQAMAHYRQTGQHLGIFDDPQQATAYAKLLSLFQDRPK